MDYEDGVVRFPFRIPLVDCDEEDTTTTTQDEKVDGGSARTTEVRVAVPLELCDVFRKDGFVVFPTVLSLAAVAALNDRLEDVLRGSYDRGNKPDKVPRLLKGGKPTIVTPEYQNSNASGNEDAEPKKKKSPKPCAPLGFSGNLTNVKVLQIINIHKADSLFRKLETDPQLGQVVAQLAGWKHGARLAQDQIWAKPPGAAPLVFHRDSPYFMFEPSDVVTVWIALDDMDEILGPLEYVRKSHLWGEGRVGSSSQFFQNNVMSLLRSAAEREGLDLDQLDIVSLAGLKAGGLSIHHGKVWHGSRKNNSNSRPRRGLGLHFVPAEVRFTAEALHSRLWGPYVEHAEDPSQIDLSDEDFPMVSS